jgi:hypothetical protein
MPRTERVLAATEPCHYDNVADRHLVQIEVVGRAATQSSSSAAVCAGLESENATEASVDIAHEGCWKVPGLGVQVCFVHGD